MKKFIAMLLVAGALITAVGCGSSGTTGGKAGTGGTGGTGAKP